MRKITKESIDAFMGGYSFKKQNMEIRVKGEGCYMFLHGNCIAIRTDEGIFISNAGWETLTTKERLNGLLDSLGLERIYQKRFIWYRGNTRFSYNFFEKVA